jgi:hypothetical protein
MLPVVRAGGGYAIDLSGEASGTTSWDTMTVGVKIDHGEVLDGQVGYVSSVVATIDGTCPQIGAEVDFTVLPGTYTIRVEDPGGLGEAQSQEITRNFMHSNRTLYYDHGALPAPVLKEVGDALSSLAQQCADSRLKGAACSASVQVDGEAEVGADDAVKVAGEAGVEALTQDEAGIWHVISSEIPFESGAGHGSGTVLGAYSGSVRRDAAGRVAIELDQ